MFLRTIGDLNMSIATNEKGQDYVRTLSATVNKGDECHFVKVLDGEWYCDCLGFTTHQKCRHVSALQILHSGINEKFAEAMNLLNAPRGSTF